ncbi:MAG: hypothetical protein ACOY4Q_09745, partial [Bacillota bacterium]
MNKNGGAGSSKTGLVFFPAFDWAISPNHPEREERLLYTRDQIFEEGLMDVMLARDDNVVIYGEDVGYFGGVFRCT